MNRAWNCVAVLNVFFGLYCVVPPTRSQVDMCATTQTTARSEKPAYKPDTLVISKLYPSSY